MSADLSVDLTGQIKQIHTRFFRNTKGGRKGKRSQSTNRTGAGAFDGEIWPTGLTDDDVLSKARNMRDGKGAKFAKAFDGDVSDFPSHSEADMYVIGVLAFFHGDDPEAIDRNFRSSGLFRPDKWDELRGSDTYGNLTIGKVLREKGGDRSKYWSPDGKAKARADSSASEPDAERFRILYDDEVENLPPSEWLVDEYLLKDTIAGLYGPSESGKSVLALDIALSLPFGRDWQGRKVRPGPAVYIAAEGVSGMGARIKAWKKEHDLTGRQGVGFLFDEVNFLNETEREGFIAKLRTLEKNPALVIIDTWAWAMAGGDENQVKDVMAAMDGVKQIRREFGSTVLIVHHTTIGGTRERGSSSFRNGLDTMIHMSQQKGVISLEVTKQKDAPKPPVRQFKLKIVQLADADATGDDLTIDLNSSVVLEPITPDSASVRGFLLSESERSMLDTLQRLNTVDGPVGATVWQKTSTVVSSEFYRIRPVLLAQEYAASTGGGRAKYSITEKGENALKPFTSHTKEETSNGPA